VERKLGEALLAIGHDEEAEALLRDYVDKDPERAEIFRSIDMRRGGKQDEAIELFREVLKKNPNSVNAMRHLAECYWRGKKRFDDAEALLRRATKIAPDFTAAWLTLGRLLMDMNRYVEAIDAYETATRLEPENADAWGALGNANGRAMYPEKAVYATALLVCLHPMRGNSRPLVSRRPPWMPIAVRSRQIQAMDLLTGAWRISRFLNSKTKKLKKCCGRSRTKICRRSTTYTFGLP
jgi:predicted Zn-dependent protease